MLREVHAEQPAKQIVSELVLSDRLIALAQDADRAGYTATAEHLVTLACSVFDEVHRAAHCPRRHKATQQHH